jgi:hypothetical protein
MTRLTLGEDREGMRAGLGAISLVVGPPGGDSSLPPPLGLDGASGWAPLLVEEPMLLLAALPSWWALEEPEPEGVDDTRERKLGITRCLKSDCTRIRIKLRIFSIKLRRKCTFDFKLHL